MLNPNNDRLDYGQIIAPPVDYKLDFAIGTTYSLDLHQLMIQANQKYRIFATVITIRTYTIKID